MLKNTETHDKVIIQKMVQLPFDIAAEVLTGYCTNNTNAPCALLCMGDEESCLFGVTHCTDVTVDMWKEYLNE